MTKFTKWLTGAFAEHAVVAGGIAAGGKLLQSLADVGVEKAGEAIMRKFTTEDRMEANQLLTKALYDTRLIPQEREGAKVVNFYYANLDPDGRDRFERLVGYSWAVMKDGIGALDLKQVEKTEERPQQKKGEEPKPLKTKTVLIPNNPPDLAFMKHWTQVGMMGEKFIILELDKLDKSSPWTRVVSSGEAVIDFIDGFTNGEKR